MAKILLTRHGHVEGIDPPRFRGRTDLPLTALGEAQAKAVAERIAANWRPKAVYTSPMTRCVTTGRHIAAACRIGSAVLEELNDLDYGRWTGKTYDEIRENDAALFERWFAMPHLVRFPDGEALQDIVARAADALRFVLDRHREEAEAVVLVGHDSTNRALLLQLLDQPLSAYWRIAQAPCTLNEVDVIAGSIRALRINETAHLESVA